MDDAIHTHRYEPPRIESSTSIAAPLVAVAPSGADVSAAFRPF